jgi:DNA mismatch endonuclease (patch repair protein)
MSRIRSKGMAPEIILRRLVYGMGYRYRLHRGDLPGKPDLVFPGRKKIIFVHGCFWHQHAKCKDGHLPKTNLAYWIPKLERNIQRDKKVVEELVEMGWDVLVIWECELADRDLLSIKLNQFLSVNQPNKL